MALPSQIGQGGSISRISSSGRRDKGGRTIMVISAGTLIVAAAALTWIMLKGHDANLPSAAQPAREPVVSGVQEPDAPGAAPAAASTPAPEPPIALISQASPRTASIGSGPDRTDSAPNSTNGRSTTSPAASPQSDLSRPAPIDLTRSGDPAVRPEGAVSASATPSPAAPLAASTSSAGVRALIDEADRKAAAGDPVAARALFSRALADDRTTASDQSSLRDKLGRLNEDLIFSSRYFPGEPFTEQYTVQSGDNPTRIVRKRGVVTEPRLIEKTNKIDATRLQVGQKLKLIRGPFHAVVHKADFRLDLYAGSPDDQSTWVFIKSFKVGLGESNSTPVGTFVVKSNSKLINPPWTNPRTGEKFLADDPKNPIGERWIGIEGVGDARQFTGFGLHGTIDPESIGKMKSMGCVRMAGPDVETVYDLLTEKVSVVRIEP